MKILLVEPRFPASLWDFSGSRDLDGCKYAYPPLALATVAGLTPREHEVAIADENVRPVPLDGEADLVGITGLWLQRDRMLELADAFRARGKCVAIGGPAVDDRTRALFLEHADHVFQGEAEETWPAFLSELAAGNVPRREWVQRELVDMRRSPRPRYELLDVRAYPTATIETSRGCPYTCEFCEIPIRLGQKARTKTTAQVMDEVESIAALGADSIFLVDDHFIGNKTHATEVLEALAAFSRRTSFRVRFTCQMTVNLTRDEKLLEKMRAANIRRVFVGLETPRKEGLSSVKKHQNTVVDLVEAVHALQRHNITVWAGIIVGFDTDDARVFDDQLEFLARAGVPVVMAGLLQAIPGTPLHARMAREGRLRDLELSGAPGERRHVAGAPDLTMSGVRGTHEAMLVTNIEPRCMSDEDLARGYQRLVRELYDEERFADRLVASIRRGAFPIPERAGFPPLRHLATLGRIVGHYVLGPARRRRMFVRVMRDTLRHRPRDVETALMHLVLYKHLRSFHEELARFPIPRAALSRPAVAVL